MKTGMIHKLPWAGPAVLSLAAIVLLVGAMLSGCTDTLQGERNPNQKPVVHFANIPPEDQTFSRNPIVYWYGTDVDGLIDLYRYYVATESELNGTDPEDFILTLDDSAWVYIDVDPASAEPQTTQSISLVADTANPVRGFVAQWVFLQAFDLEGLGSEIVFRKFSRNDNPPTTNILDYGSSLPFVNAPRPGGVVTGVRISWTAADRVDYPTDPPPFEFQWRLYGPYTDDEVVQISSQFFMDAFQTNDGFIILEGDTLEVCDTLYSGVDTIINCEYYQVGTDPIPTYLGTFLTQTAVDIAGYFNISDPAFQGNPAWNRIADSSCSTDESGNCLSEWVSDTRDTIYDVFWDDPSDTTVEKRFIFWIRSRDDALVPDPSPAFRLLNVINPKYERDVFVMDWAVVMALPPPAIRIAGNYTDTVAIYRWWRERLSNWMPNINFDFRDYGFKRGRYNGGIPLRTLLQHKVVILYNDCVNGPPIYDAVWMKNIFKAIDAGVNIWATNRAGLGRSSGDLEIGDIPELHNDPEGQQFSFYFAVNRGLYSGWFQHAFYKASTEDANPSTFGTPPPFNVQDCMGGYSLNTALWPDIEYDSARVHRLYAWSYGIFNFWDSNVPYLPEINWAEARYGAEVMYLYKSHYGSRGASHPMGVREVQGMLFDYNFEGAPMAHRYNSGLFKTVHMNFTPYGLMQDTITWDDDVQVLFDNVMDFLYDPRTTQPVSELRYDDAAVKLSVAEQRARYWKRCDLETLENGGFISREAMENLRRTR